MATWRAPQLGERQAWGRDPKKKVGSAHFGVLSFGSILQANDWTGEILIRFCNFQDMLGQLRPRGRSLSPDFRLPRFFNSDVKDFDTDDHTTCDKGLDPTPQKRNIARITKTALQRCLGKPSLNVNRIFPVCPVWMSDVIHFDNDDHLLCYLMILKAHWSADNEIVVQNIDDAIWWYWRFSFCRHVDSLIRQSRALSMVSKETKRVSSHLPEFNFETVVRAWIFLI